MRALGPGDIVDSRIVETVQSNHARIPDPMRVTHLQFRRFAGCPMCNLHLRAFIQRSDELIAHGVQEVVVFHSSKEDLRQHLETETPVALIADPARLLYKEFGVEQSLRAVLHPRAWAAAAKGIWQFGAGLPRSGESALGLPADFLIEPSGRIRHCRYGTYAYDHWEVDEVLILARNQHEHPG